jgi:hypothetical protein
VFVIGAMAVFSPLEVIPQNSIRDRRSGRRYSITLQLEWKLFSRKRLVDMGTGTTVDLSNDGILFEADHKPAATGLMELRITWPARPENFLSMHLTVIGRVVRVAGTRVAIRIRQHAFSIISR